MKILGDGKWAERIFFNLKIHFKHYSGSISQYDYLFFDCMAELKPQEENEALEGGWLPDDYLIIKNKNGKTKSSRWYQARQTRIALKNYKDTKSAKKTRKKCSDINVKSIKANEVDMPELELIFSKYTQYKNFKQWELKPLISSEVERKNILIYYLNNKAIAFTFMRDVGSNSVFSTQFAWDYQNPKLYLGKYATLAEIDHSINSGRDYMYLGLGYEKCCIYKSDYNGFEFWTGEEWSNDVEHYKFLCERDSKIIKTSDLDKVKRHDDKYFYNK